MRVSKITFDIAQQRIKEKYPYLTLLKFTSPNEEATFLDHDYGEFTARSFRSVYRETKSHPERAKINKKERYKKTCLEKYGVENPSKSKKIKEKRKQTNLEKYGVEYPIQNQEVKNKTRQTNLKRYGVTTPAQNKEILKKIKQTNLEKYGSQCSLQNKNVQNKIKKTNLKKYGTEYAIESEKVRNIIAKNIKEKYNVTHISQISSTKEKIKHTNLKKYGVEYTLQDKTIREKIKQTNLKLYGAENPQQNKEIRDKTIKTNIQKYGCKNQFSNNTIKEKIKKTNLIKYNTEVPSKNPVIKEKIKQTNFDNNNWHNINGKSLSEYYRNSDLPIKYITLNRNYRKYGSIALKKDHYNLLHGKSKLANLWLDLIEKELDYKLIREYNVPDTKYRADGYDPNTNTIYEFYGDIWHGNLNKFSSNEKNPINNILYKDLYNETINREKELKSLGYNIIYIWESKFDGITSCTK